MFDNLTSIYLPCFNNKKYIAALANTIEEFENLQNKIKRESNKFRNPLLTKWLCFKLVLKFDYYC
jgi:hypothetical protein